MHVALAPAKAIALLAVSLAAGAILASSAKQHGQAILISAKFYRVSTPIDTMAIKAIGSRDTKASPTILQVTKEEAARVAKVSGAVLIGSPAVKTLVDEQAKVEAKGDGDSYSLDVKPSTKGSDTITLNFRIAITNVIGTKRLTRSAGGMARVQEAKALLIIENPRNGQPGFLAVVDAHRVK
jgi:hypothetical protein